MMEGKRVKLRILNAEDRESYIDIANDAVEDDIKRYTNNLYAKDAEEFEIICNKQYKYKGINIYVILDETDEMIGAVETNKVATRCMEISYFIAKRYRKRGYCAEVLSLLYERLSMEKKYSLGFEIMKNNLESIKLIQKLFLDMLKQVELENKVYYEVKKKTKRQY